VDSPEKKPSVTDYLAAAVLAYGVVYVWLQASQLWTTPWALSYLVYYAGSATSTYLVLRKTTRNQFPVALKSAAFSWVFTIACLIAFTRGNVAPFFKSLLALYLLGGVSASVVAMRERLRRARAEAG